jgi:hypothetical protein
MTCSRGDARPYLKWLTEQADSQGGTVPKKELMAQVAEAVGKSTVASAAISNASSFVSQKARPSYVPDPIYMGTLPPFSKDGQSPYFGLGKKILDAAKPFSASCEVLSCATVVLLARPGTGLLKKQGVRVELVGYKDSVETKSGPKIATTGHVFLVVARATDSDLNDPTTWGEGFAVDQWWTSQRTGPDSPVKDPASGSAYSDATYFGFMKERKLASYGELST